MTKRNRDNWYAVERYEKHGMIGRDLVQASTAGDALRAIVPAMFQWTAEIHEDSERRATAVDVVSDRAPAWIAEAVTGRAVGIGY